ncbi:MAG: ABC transporter ATP-binding protein [Nitrospirales bacterium]|nr:MAG: ABC transporter ATP-binding protein [Nitrospirales bacterium]
MSLINFLLRASYGKVALAMVAGVVSGLAGAGMLALINRALHADRSSGVIVMWGFIGVTLIALIMRVVSELLLIRLGQATIATLRMQLSRQILASPLRHLEMLGAPRLLAVLTEDVSAISSAFVTLPLVCIHVATVIGCLGYLGWLSWPLMVVVIGMMGFGAMIFRIQEASAVSSLRSAREANDGLHHHFRAMAEGAKELKLHRGRRSAFISQALQEAVSHYQRQFVAGMTTYTMAGSWSSLLLYLAIGLLLFGLPFLQDVPAETMTGYILVLLYMVTPFELVVDAVPGFGRAAVSLRKIEQLGLVLSAPAQNTGEALIHSGLPENLRSRPVPNWERLEFVGVEHQYHHERESHNFRLGPLNMVFHPGEVVFLIGGNGSGKTTLAMLLLGLYVPEGGEIRWDGEPITDENREDYRQHFSAVFSEFYLFESFLGLNAPQLKMQAEEYLRQLELDHKVTVEENRLSTVNLSRGQRKRLALLTALLEDRPFYVFDEWAADQDPVFKELFYHRFLPQLRAAGKSILVITHDDQYFNVADRCIKMDFGQITHVTQRTVVQV